MSDETMEAYLAWLPPSERRQQDFQGYLQDVAYARSVARRVFRLIDEQAKLAGLEPLQHQALLQIAGAPGEPRHVNDIADLLDIAPAFASRLVRQLEQRELVARTISVRDRRVSDLTATTRGIELLQEIDREVHLHVSYFQSQLTTRQRAAALGIFSFYVGAELSRDAEGIAVQLPGRL